MGKKRNNSTKKKQATKNKKRLSSAYGVSVLKGGTIDRNNGVIDKAALADGNAHAKRQNGASNASTQAHGGNKGAAHTSTREAVSKRSRNGKNENDDFHRQHASLEERSLALQAHKDDRRRSKKGRQKKGWGNFARPSDPKFAPATLTLAPKTAHELVNDTADQVAQSMNEIGQRVTNFSNSGALAVPGQSTLAAAAGLNWQRRVSSVPNEAQQPQIQNNPFSALDHDSDSDNEWGDQKKSRIQQFQFKPASFSFQASVSSPPGAVIGVGDDIDPDL